MLYIYIYTHIHLVILYGIMHYIYAYIGDTNHVGDTECIRQRKTRKSNGHPWLLNVANVFANMSTCSLSPTCEPPYNISIYVYFIILYSIQHITLYYIKIIVYRIIIIHILHIYISYIYIYNDILGYIYIYIYIYLHKFIFLYYII